MAQARKAAGQPYADPRLPTRPPCCIESLGELAAPLVQELNQGEASLIQIYRVVADIFTAPSGGQRGLNAQITCLPADAVVGSLVHDLVAATLPRAEGTVMIIPPTGGFDPGTDSFKGEEHDASNPQPPQHDSRTDLPCCPSERLLDAAGVWLRWADCWMH